MFKVCKTDANQKLIKLKKNRLYAGSWINVINPSGEELEKIAVDEETVRLRSHISQLRELVNSDETIGRKLDFIVQEMNREVNTIGSKAQDLNITKIVVDMKAELEKIREQIQNIE